MPARGRNFRRQGGYLLKGHELLERRIVFEGKVIRLYLDKVLLPDGREAEREVVGHWGAVGVVPLDGEGGIFLVQQYRHATGEDLLEIPAGKLTKGEDPLECAKRELTEEIGVSAKKWQELCRFYTSPGFSDEMLHLFMAEELEQGKPCPDEDEFLAIKKVKISEAFDMLRGGTIRDSKTAVGVLFAYMHHKGLI